MPAIFNYFLTGKKFSEFTFATTTQLYSPALKDWDPYILDLLEIKKELFQ